MLQASLWNKLQRRFFVSMIVAALAWKFGVGEKKF